MFNILLITADQWRGDCLSHAGHPVVRTPNVDALAAEGTSFLSHYAGAAPCSPARACLYTGLYQMNNRVCRNGSPLASRFDNIARLARRAGYDPTLFGYTDVSPDPTGMPAADPDLRSYEGVLPGFTTRLKLPEHERAWLSWLRQQGLDFADRDLAHMPLGDRRHVTDAPPAYDREQTQTAFVASEFIRWLGEQQSGQPWFAHVSFLRPHPPFVVPEPYNRMYSAADVPGFRRAPTPDDEAAQHPLAERIMNATPSDKFVAGGPELVRDLTDADFRQIKATYFGMIAEVDDQLGRIWTALRDRGDWANTLIIFTSDHAEMMGDHWTLGKGGYHDQGFHIPLVVRHPDVVSRGNRVEAFTEAVDILPTLAGAMGIEPLHHPDGSSLLSLLGGSVPEDWRRAVHFEFDFRDVSGRSAENYFALPSTRLNLAVIRTQTEKYVHFAGLPPLLFDLRVDPDCLDNLAGRPEHLATQLRLAEDLLAWRAEHLDQTLALKELTDEGVVAGRP